MTDIGKDDSPGVGSNTFHIHCNEAMYPLVIYVWHLSQSLYQFTYSLWLMCLIFTQQLKCIVADFPYYGSRYCGIGIVNCVNQRRIDITQMLLL